MTDSNWIEVRYTGHDDWYYIEDFDLDFNLDWDFVIGDEVDSDELYDLEVQGIVVIYL